MSETSKRGGAGPLRDSLPSPAELANHLRLQLEGVSTLNGVEVFHVLQFDEGISSLLSAPPSNVQGGSPPEPLQTKVGQGKFGQKVEQLIVYVQELEVWSHRVDLVAPAPLQTLIDRHIVDSIAAFSALEAFVLTTEGKPFAEALKGPYLDVGSGAGLPGLVWAILRPERQTTLLEPREKRVLFLKEMVRKLGLVNVRIAQSRLEDFAPPEPIALVTGRALGKEVDLFGGTKRFGALTVLLGGERSAEGALPGVCPLPYSLPNLDRPRLLLIRSTS